MNVLRMLGMAEGEIERPARQRTAPDVSVLRSRNGGILLSASARRR